VDLNEADQDVLGTVQEIISACESMTGLPYDGEPVDLAGVPYDGPREHHGESAARWLEPRVGSRIAWLAEQHVAAKRYLVAVDGAYRA
jgi:hypothetical protein